MQAKNDGAKLVFVSDKADRDSLIEAGGRIIRGAKDANGEEFWIVDVSRLPADMSQVQSSAIAFSSDNLVMTF